MLHIHTSRLDLIPCPIELAKALIISKAHAEALLSVKIPYDWPACDLQEFLPWYVRQLEADPSQYGWVIWLMIHRADRTVVGDLGFREKPDRGGTVEIGYNIIPAYRRQGLTFEAVRALVDWALSQPDTKRIIARCTQDNIVSMYILSKLGMQKSESHGFIVKWELKKAGCPMPFKL